MVHRPGTKGYERMAKYGQLKREGPIGESIAILLLYQGIITPYDLMAQLISSPNCHDIEFTLQEITRIMNSGVLKVSFERNRRSFEIKTILSLI